MLRRSWTAFCLVLLALVLLFGILNLFERRFDEGEFYSPYSSLRSGPLGTSVLFESWPSLPGRTTSRYYESKFTENAGAGRALMVLGTTPELLRHVDAEEFNTINQFIESGGLVVVGLTGGNPKEITHPETGPSDPDPKKKEADSKRTAEKLRPDRKVPVNKYANKSREPVDLEVRWGFRMDHRPLPLDGEGNAIFPETQPASEFASRSTPLKVHSGIFFTGLTNGWKTVAQARQLPVIVSRSFGKGKVVILSESYWFSNEAMQGDRPTDFLVGLLGDRRALIFDEAHLGTVVEHGTAELMRKYGLQGLVLGLLILVGLFIWRNSTSLVPPTSVGIGASSARIVTGRDSGAAFTQLLRRSVPQRELIPTCIRVWQESSQHSKWSAEVHREMNSFAEADRATEGISRHPADLYRTISQRLRRR